jgi:hypothetical protein
MSSKYNKSPVYFWQEKCYDYFPVFSRNQQNRKIKNKSFCGGPGGGFSKKSPLAAGGKTGGK